MNVPLGIVIPFPVQVTVLLEAEGIERLTVTPKHTGLGLAVIVSLGVNK
jgi:hypothetical protein